MNALRNLKSVCDERLDSKYQIEVVDLEKNPEMARENNIMACPTVVKVAPEPRAKLIGDLSKTETLVTKFDLPNVTGSHVLGKARCVSFYGGSAFTFR